MYGTVPLANQFFSSRLHNFDWINSSENDKLRALNQAAELINQFDYSGQKYSVTILGEKPTYEQIQTANAAQEDEFPRGTSDVVPPEILKAAYLIAQALLSGRDPEMDLESRMQKTSRVGDLASTFDTEGNNLEHIAHLIPSPQAWNLIRPWLRERNQFDIIR